MLPSLFLLPPWFNQNIIQLDFLKAMCRVSVEQSIFALHPTLKVIYLQKYFAVGRILKLKVICHI